MIFHKYKPDKEHEIVHKIRRLEHLLSKALSVLINWRAAITDIQIMA